MEILKTVEIAKYTAWYDILFILGLGFTLSFIILLVTATDRVSNAHYWAIGICFVGMIASMIAFACIHKTPTGQYTYTVSITDPEKYKELIDNGYQISEPLYENVDIYEITGNPLQ